MNATTADLGVIRWSGGVIRIAAVATDENLRTQIARAFDRAPANWDVSLHVDAPTEADVVVTGPDAKLDGAVRFDPADPERLIAEIHSVTEARANSRCIFVASATGGCGATTLALHLASFDRSCVLEASGSDVRRRLGLGSARSWSLDPVGTFEGSALPVSPGLRVLLAPRGATLADLVPVTTAARRSFSSVYVDCRAEWLPELTERGDIGVLVMHPSRPAAERARRVLDECSDLRWAIVSNRVGPGSGLTRTRLEGLLERKLSIELPCSAALRDAEDDGALVTSHLSRWLWRVKRLWRALQTA